MTDKGYTLNAEVNVQMENDKVYFVGEACTDEYVTLNQLEDINQYFINQPVVYRHDHPSKGKGGSIYGRVVESKIVENENGTHILKFKSLMKQTLKKHKDLINLAETQQDLGSPISYSVGFLGTKTAKVDEADVYEVSVTNDPVCTECQNINIMEKKIMPNEELESQEDEKDAKVEVEKKVEKETIKEKVSENQKDFEESIGFIKELEKKNGELEAKVSNYEKVIGESKGIMDEYCVRLRELEKKADFAERSPLIEKIFTLERNEFMRKRYEEPKIWGIKELGDQYEAVKNLNKHKIQAQKAVVRTLEQSRYKLMDRDNEKQDVSEFEAKIKGKMSPELKKSLGMEEINYE